MKRSFVVLASLIVLAGMPPANLRNLEPQSKPGAPPSVSSVSEKRSDPEFRGEGLFLQRCSLCHLPRKLKFGSPSVIGPSLSGQFKDATPEQMKVLRNFILKGGPNMPGFQYGLEPAEVDDLISYLKTL